MNALFGEVIKMRKNNKYDKGSFIKASIVDGDVTIPPNIIIKTKNAYEAIGLLCALSGEILLTHSKLEKELAIRMKNDILQTMNSMFDKIIEDLE